MLTQHVQEEHEEHNFVTGEDFGIVHLHSNNSLLFPSIPLLGV